MEKIKNYLYASPSDRVEMVKNCMHTQAMRLLQKIKEDLDPSSFTLREIQENFNAYTPVTKPDYTDKEVMPYIDVVRVRYGKSHLDYLKNKGLIDHDPESGQYYLIKEHEKLETTDDDVEDKKN